ncbi:MAG TPA: lipid-A-disaccharide synthase [Pyrinomonadaceae bacterium]|nr:lipid-A-disaccharide synthase [Pyrinomonadaceae bacterium]
MTATRDLSLMIVAGEPSGDAHAAALVQALRIEVPGTNFFGATGPMLRAAGVDSIVNTDDLSILGLVEIGRALPRFWRAFRGLRQAAIERKPQGIILVDWPDFNLRLARSLHRRGFKIIYYISPQLWAWRSHRIRNIQRDVDLMLSILPFELPWYQQRSVSHVEFVGHPLAGEVQARYGKQEFCRLNDLDTSRPIISLLPGSRHKELQRILPSMLDAVPLIRRKCPDVQFALALAPGRSPEQARHILAMRNGGEQTVRIVQHATREALAASDVAAIASGTATLEAALLGTPMVIAYKESAINWHILGRLITADHFGLVNLIAGERIATELMQNELKGENLARELLGLLEPQRNREARKQLSSIARQLGDSRASHRAAKRILAEIDSVG